MELNEKGIPPLLFSVGVVWAVAYVWLARWLWHVAQPNGEWWEFPFFMTLGLGVFLPVVAVAIWAVIAYIED